MSVESSLFGSEFIAMKQCCMYLWGLQYKMRMMGIPCELPVFIFSDNNRNMSNSKGWTLQSSLLMLWMEKTRVNNQTTIDDKWKTY